MTKITDVLSYDTPSFIERTLEIGQFWQVKEGKKWIAIAIATICGTLFLGVIRLAFSNYFPKKKINALNPKEFAKLQISEQKQWINKHPTYFEHAHQELKKNEELVLELIKKNKKTFIYANSALQNAILLKNLKLVETLWQYIDNSLFEKFNPFYILLTGNGTQCLEVLKTESFTKSLTEDSIKQLLKFFNENSITEKFSKVNKEKILLQLNEQSNLLKKTSFNTI